MAGAITDLLDRVSDSSTGRPVISSLSAGKAIGAASITLTDATNWTTTTAIHFSIYATTTIQTAGGTVTVKDASTQTDWKGTLSGTTVSNLTLTGGTDRAYTTGAIVEVTPTARWAKDLYDNVITHANQDGGLKQAPVLTAIGTGGITDTQIAGVSTAKLTIPYKFSAYTTGASFLSTFTYSKVNFQSEVFDTGSNFDNTTNYRFTAPANGFYAFNAQVNFFVNNSVVAKIAYYKNGVLFRESPLVQNATGGSNHIGVTLPLFTQLTTGDYLEIWGVTNQGSAANADVGQSQTYFEGHLVSTT